MRTPKMGRGLLVPLAIVGLWGLASANGWVNPYLLPSPRTALEAATGSWSSGVLQGHVASSIGRILVGFAVASAIGVPLGLALGLSRGLRRALDPTLQFLRQIPPIAWIPLFLLWFGIGEGSKQAVIVYATVFPILVNSELGVAQADEHILEAARAYCLSSRQTMLKVVLPGALPSVFAGLRLGLGNSWRALVAAEMIAATRGVGAMIAESRSLSQPEGVILGIIIIGIAGSAMDIAIVRLEALCTPWRGGTPSGS